MWADNKPHRIFLRHKLAFMPQTHAAAIVTFGRVRIVDSARRYAAYASSVLEAIPL